jgi:hypothetical protein
MNRDELIKSFCDFRSELDDLFQIVSIDKEAKTFWPNICCKERHDVDSEKTLETCKPPKDSDVKPKDMIPFALSQGGNFTRHNLYVEVSETIKEGGHLHNGMMKLLEKVISLKHFKIHDPKLISAKEQIRSFFNGISLCGPVIIDAPDEKKMCELFIPYRHSMKEFVKLFKGLYIPDNLVRVKVQESSSFLETMEQSLLNRQLTSRKTRLGKSGKNTLTSVAAAMQSKAVKNVHLEQACKHTNAIVKTEANEMKKRYCRGVEHIDLYSTDVKNIAIYHFHNQISKEYYHSKTNMIGLAEKIRYKVTDSSCPSKLFDADDISFQQIAMDATSTKKEWAAVVNLNTNSLDGYFQSELRYCKAKKYLIGTIVEVKAYIDGNNCCNDYRDFDMCVRDYNHCEKELESQKLADVNNKHFVRSVTLKGSEYEIVDPHKTRKRRLLTKMGSKNAS